MNEMKEIVMVSSTGKDPSHKKPCFLKPILPYSSIDEPLKLSQGFTSLPVPSTFDPKNWPFKLDFRGWRFNHHDLQTWVSHLAPVYQSTWKKAGIFEAIFNSTYKIKRKKDLVYGLAEKWCCETNTFVFPWGEATITLEDVRVLGGFSVLGHSVFSPLERRELREVEAKLEKERMGLVDHSAGCRTATTKAWMEKFMKSGSELEHEAFLVFWLSRYVFHNRYVNEVVLSIAIRLARGIQVALAPAVLAHIYKDLSVLKMTIAALSGLKDRNEVVEVTIVSQFHLVQVWAWERFVELRPVSNDVSCAEPRLARWDKVECLNVGNVRHVFDKAGECFIWRPYAMNSKNNVFPVYDFEMEKWVLVGPYLDDEHGLMSFAMFLTVAKLVGFGTKQRYFPDRVAMQFGFYQDLPCSLPIRRIADNDIVPLGSPPTCNQVDARDPMDEDTSSISEVLKHCKTEKNSETKESGDYENISGQVQNLESSCMEKVIGNTKRSEAMKEVLMTEALDGASEAKCDQLNAMNSITGSPNNYMASTIGNGISSGSSFFETRVKRLYLLS